MGRRGSFRTHLSRTPILRGVARFLHRFLSGGRHVVQPMATFAGWLVTSREYTNYTYDLEDRNKRHLAAFVAEVVDRSYSEMLEHIREIEEDTELRTSIASGVAGAPRGRESDFDMPFGRRLGWYAIVRAVKPKIVVETGVEKGLGACVLAAALRKNSEEGYEGRYFGTDINPEAGYLLRGDYAKYGEILYGDSIESLSGLDENIDVFINDSDHSAEYEAREYDVVRDKLTEHAFILGDNAHSSDALLNFALDTDRRFLFFREEPSGHWYPGAGIGAAFRKAAGR